MGSKKPAPAGRAGFFNEQVIPLERQLHPDDDNRDVNEAEGHARKRARKTLNHVDFPCFDAVQHNSISS
jgi:hypothetical protein